MLLKILALPRSSYYYHIKQLKPVDKNKVLKAKIKMIYDETKETMAIIVSLWN